MKYQYLKPENKTPAGYLAAVARARGCATENEINEFFAELPPIRNRIALLPDYAVAAKRLRRAIAEHERIIIFGDWDCDGVLSLVQMRDLLCAAGHEATHWFIPDRRAEDYGLTQEAVERCYEMYRPQLIISVDCGSPSHTPAAWLKTRGTDLIVVDHHQPGDSNAVAKHPAVAHLNPKIVPADTREIAELQELSAAGLCYLFCKQFARENELREWDPERALILGGVGTVVDVMKLTGVNRAVAKHALQLARDPQTFARVPGLVALHEAARAGEISANTFGFVWGPRLNASGRLEEATAAVKLLLAETLDDARPFAAQCQNANEERRRIQDGIARAAEQQAAAQMQNLPPEQTRVLVLFEQSWNPGVVGIVASRIKDRYNRPTIVLGWHAEGYCKGSGRSLPAFDLGAAIQQAVKDGIILGGGGHRMAAGVKTTLEQVDGLRVWLNTHCGLQADDFEPETEILGRVESLPVESWKEVFARLEPFGNGNPRPALYYGNARLAWGLQEMKTKSGEIWAIKAGFRAGAGEMIFALWTDVKAAQSLWRIGENYNLALSLAFRRYNGKDYFDWRVEACEALKAGARANAAS